MTTIDTVFWANQPQTKGSNRPSQLVERLVRLGLIASDSQYWYHGKPGDSGKWNRLSKADIVLRLPWRGSGRSLSVLSPVSPVASLASPIWSDYYDDWSLAPDIHPLYRVSSAVTYANVRRRTGQARLTTCNSEYMRGKLRLPVSSLIPNGVEPEIATLQRRGDMLRRLVVLGHFFPGRTDFGLFKQVIGAGGFDHIVIGGAGRTRHMADVVNYARRHCRVLENRPWLTQLDLAELSGPKTVALIPHVVSSYTLSQDPMKTYSFLALGMKLVIPRLILPRWIDDESVYLVDHGCRLAQTLPEWIDAPAPTDDWRKDFADRHSWGRRADQIATLLGELEASC